MLKTDPKPTVKGLIRGLCGPAIAGCGTCTYVLYEGVYVRTVDGCDEGCACPSSLTQLEVSLLRVVCPKIVTLNGVVVGCKAQTMIAGEPTKLAELFRLLLEGYKFWRLVSLGLGLLAVVLAGVVVYLLMRG